MNETDLLVSRVGVSLRDTGYVGLGVRCPSRVAVQQVLPHSFQGDAFVGNNAWEVCGQPVACPGHELSGLAAHLPGGQEACSQCSRSQHTHKIDQWLMQKEGSLSVLPISRYLAGLLASPPC